MLSIITPVYNGEKYIESCIKSVISSGLQEFEHIIINDGSTDNTKEILDEFVGKYNFLKVYNTKNQGQGLARNLGIDAADGEYIAFLDVDDTLEKDGLQDLYKFGVEKNFDIVSGTYFRKNSQGRELVGSNFTEGILKREGSQEETRLYNNMKTQSIFGYLWNKIYKRDFLLKNNLWMDDIKEVYMEDTAFNIRAFAKNPYYFHTNHPVYCYNVLDESTTRKYEPEIAVKNVKMLTKLYDKLKSDGDLEISMDLLVPLAIRSFCWSIVRNNFYEGNLYKKKLEYIKTFTGNEYFKKIICAKNSPKEIKKLPSFMERFFFGSCMLLIKLGLDVLLALGFKMGNPLMQSYINKNLK